MPNPVAQRGWEEGVSFLFPQEKGLTVIHGYRTPDTLQVRPGVIEISKGLKALAVLEGDLSSIPSARTAGHAHL